MEKHVEAFILAAESKALATGTGESLNVVPVSSISVHDGDIWLINYFMDKTLANILATKRAAFVCWTKMMGYQIKGEVAYVTEGEKYDVAVAWIRSVLPDRVVKGLIILTPQEVYDVSPTKNTKEKFLGA